tara:strand:- start:569 stop:1003 length:435 start_codon:yes stop_codon:yes gene_type:complete
MDKPLPFLLIKNVLGCIKKVNTEMGDYYKENIYQEALNIELRGLGLASGTEVVVPIHYKGIYVGFERADIVIYDKVGDNEPYVVMIIELKSQNSKLTTKEIVQLKKYLKNLRCETGILVNFYETPEIICITPDVTEKIPYDTLH